MNTVTRTLATLVAAVAALSLAGCSNQPITEVHANTYKEAKHSELGQDIPMAVAHDATNIRLANETANPRPETLIRWDSATPPEAKPGYCVQGALPHAPKITASWWPKTTPSTGEKCTVWATFERNGHRYAWDVRG